MSDEKPKAVVYLDLNNLFHRYKKLDFIKLRKELAKKYDLVRVSAYTAINLQDENQRKFIIYLSNNNYKVTTIDLTENTDMDSIIICDIINDSCSKLDYSDIVFIGSDGDFGYPLSLLSRKGYKINIIGCKDNTSLELLKCADISETLESYGVILQ